MAAESQSHPAIAPPDISHSLSAWASTRGVASDLAQFSRSNRFAPRLTIRCEGWGCGAFLGWWSTCASGVRYNCENVSMGLTLFLRVTIHHDSFPTLPRTALGAEEVELERRGLGRQCNEIPPFAH